MLAPTHIGTDKALPFLKIIQTMKNEHVLPNHCFHETKKSIQQGLNRGELQLNDISIINKQHIALLGNSAEQYQVVIDALSHYKTHNS